MRINLTPSSSAFLQLDGVLLGGTSSGGVTGDPTGPEARAFYALQLQGVL
jgi:hypothetical protein